MVSVSDVEAAIRPGETSLVSVMMVNNEIGVVRSAFYSTSVSRSVTQSQSLPLTLSISVTLSLPLSYVFKAEAVSVPTHTLATPRGKPQSLALERPQSTDSSSTSMYVP